jgi:hypothetical protein
LDLFFNQCDNNKKGINNNNGNEIDDKNEIIIRTKWMKRIKK